MKFLPGIFATLLNMAAGVVLCLFALSLGEEGGPSLRLWAITIAVMVALLTISWIITGIRDSRCEEGPEWLQETPSSSTLARLILSTIRPRTLSEICDVLHYFATVDVQRNGNQYMCLDCYESGPSLYEIIHKHNCYHGLAARLYIPAVHFRDNIDYLWRQYYKRADCEVCSLTGAQQTREEAEL